MELEQARRRAVEAKLVLEEKVAALEQATVQLTELDRQRAEAFKSAKLAEYEAETDALIIEGDQLEAALLALLAAKVKFDQRLHALDNLAVVAGVNNHQNIAKNIRRGLAHRIGYSETWLGTDAKKLYSQPLADLVRYVLNGAGVELKQAS